VDGGSLTGGRIGLGGFVGSFGDRGSGGRVNGEDIEGTWA
jgi:hypothetical protein